MGLLDKAVAESRERIRSALGAIGLALPPKRITINMAPADLSKEGSHFDLPIACGILVAMDILSSEDLAHYIVLGELGLDASVAPVLGVLPAAFAACGRSLGLICPAQQGGRRHGPEGRVLSQPPLLALIHHFQGKSVLPVPCPRHLEEEIPLPDLADVRGQEGARRVLEVAAAGGITF